MKDTISWYNRKYGFNVDYVPCLGLWDLPETCDELLEMAGGNSCIDGEMREGIVLRSVDGVHSFKAVDNAFLEKYHG